MGLGFKTDRGKGGKIKLAISNPAFEFWFLLHFEYTCTLFSNCDDVIRVLAKHLPDYKKNSAGFTLLLEKSELAISNSAKVLAEMSKTDADKYPNPSTHVHLLVQTLLESSKPSWEK
ncbi:RloB family protein [Candidatus Chlorohelix sp.]|uniref:RloB family protein n=1 Tax=Candidatus Chlorohelix sp. TaxID=3139201 RepID=UPI0030356604